MSAGNLMISFGRKYKGKLIKEIDIDELEQYVEFNLKLISCHLTAMEKFKDLKILLDTYRKEVESNGKTKNKRKS